MRERASLVVVTLVMSGCGSASAPLLVPLTLCHMGRSADYSGLFEIVSTKPTVSTTRFPAKDEATLRLIEPLIADPENGRDFSTRPASRQAILTMRGTRPGDEVVALLALPEGVRAGSRVLTFIGHVVGSSVWADLGYEGTFVQENDRFWNLRLYPPTNAVSLETLRAEALRGSKLPRDEGPSCDPGHPSDAGSSGRLDGGGVP